MNVLVDTPIWSLVLRRAQRNLSPHEITLRAMTELIREGRVLMIGPIRQELLSGIREAAQFTRVRDVLRAFPDHRLEATDFERAAEMNNLCKKSGIASTPVDMLICAVSQASNAPVFTTDTDFSHYSRVLSVRTFKPR